MSGHSKWSTIKHKKAAKDAERGKIFTKLIKEITTAARQGGGDEDANPRLRTAVLAARAANMPMQNIERAIKKGTGELPGVVYEEKTYEGYGPGGVAILIDTLTDNPNRTTSEVRHLLTRHGGNLGEAGCVGWMFERKGLIRVSVSDCEEDKLMEIAIEAGAEDVTTEGDVYEIVTSFEGFNTVHDTIERAGISIASAETTKLPKTTIQVEGKQAEQVLKLMEALDDNDDVQNIYSNFDTDE
ncbi:MAG TPA: YebC/PmpR family DNA-binding transcriptional regulator [bacterium]|nr:YebC/PmpR family DNA-binding transcriptional regulator [bacterium]